MKDTKWTSEKVWELAKRLQKTDHVRRWDMHQKQRRFKFPNIKKDSYRDTYVVFGFRKKDDSFDNLEVIDFSPRAITGDIASKVGGELYDRVFFAKVVGFTDKTNALESWGIGTKNYLRKKHE